MRHKSLSTLLVTGNMNVNVNKRIILNNIYTKIIIFKLGTSTRGYSLCVKSVKYL